MWSSWGTFVDQILVGSSLEDMPGVQLGQADEAAGDALSVVC